MFPQPAPDNSARSDVLNMYKDGKGVRLIRSAGDAMAGQGDRSHVLLAHLGQEQGEPFLPKVGEVFLVNSLFYYGNDPAAARPAVVLEVPPAKLGHSPVRIVTRTHLTKTQGVWHPADPGCGCTVPGVFSDLRTVDQSAWRVPNVKFLGVLADEFFAQVVERFA
jgi:hypothetical protein